MLGIVDRPVSKVLEDGALTEGAAGVVRDGKLGAIVRGALETLGLGDTDGLGATVTLGLLRMGGLTGLETAGGRAEGIL